MAAMTIRFQCGACSQPIEVDDEWASRAVACPYCRKTIAAPGESTITDLSHVPVASPLRGGEAGPGGLAPGPGVRVAPVYHANRLAVVAAALAAALVAFAICFLWIAVTHRLELEEFAQSMTEAGGFAGMFDAQQEFYEARGGIPSWVVALGMVEGATGLTWIATLVCGVIAVRRPRRRGLAVSALVVAGLVPIVLCCGSLFWAPQL
jgi:DNA-directed RNA polymerase subunit RPC12/RpoP